MKCQIIKLMTGGTAIVCGGKTVARKKPKLYIVAKQGQEIVCILAPMRRP